MKAPRPWKEATLWMLGAGAFFVLSYGFSNWIASHRAEVPSIAFAWEERIPFLPWTIVPYWSTDLLYVLSFFLCATRSELHNHVKRIVATQMFCVAVFLAFPLRYSGAIPTVTGGFSWGFALLKTFDCPFNQAPSLHVALAVILWSKYSEHTAGTARFLLRVWIVLTAISTLTTYQHHFIDMPTGLWVGLLSLAQFPEKTFKAHPQSRTLGLGVLYLTGSLSLILLAVWLGGAAWVSLWPAGALLLVGLGYISGSCRLLEDTSRSFPARALLAPYLLAVRLNAWAWTRGDDPAHHIRTGVWVGKAPIRALPPHFKSVVHLAPEVRVRCSSVPCRGVPMLDLVVPSAAALDAAVNAIDELRNFRPTLVCCALGRSRSVSAVAAWLVATRAVPCVDAAISLIESHRRTALTSAHRWQLQRWARERNSHAA